MGRQADRRDQRDSSIGTRPLPCTCNRRCSPPAGPGRIPAEQSALCSPPAASPSSAVPGVASLPALPAVMTRSMTNSPYWAMRYKGK